MKPLLAVAALLLAAGCGSDTGDETGSRSTPQAATQEQACAQAEQVTDTYREALGDAASAQDAKAVIDGAIGGLRDIDTDAPVAARIDELAAALTGLLEGVEAGRPPAELKAQAAAIGTTTTALAQACGRAGQ